MRKITILVIALMVISVGFLSGCNESDGDSQSSEENRLVGTWKADNIYTTLGKTVTFFSDGTCSTSDILPISGLRGVWEIKDDKLVITHQHSIINSTYDYYFSENNSKLHLKNVGGENYKVFTKQ